MLNSAENTDRLGARPSNKGLGEGQPKHLLTPDLELARRFLGFFDGLYTWQTFDDVEKRKKSRRENEKDPFAQILHGPLKTLAQHLGQLNEQGAGIFLMINEGDGQGRTAKNVKRVRALCADFDGTPFGNVNRFPLKPHMVVQSSPGRWHFYWKTNGLPLDFFKPTQERLAGLFESDPVKALPLVMRVPGFWHQKAQPYMTNIIEENDLPAYSFDDVERALPPIATTTKTKVQPSLTSAGRYGEAALASELSQLAEASEGSRNNALNRAAFSLGQLIAGGELDRHQVEAALLGTAISIGLTENEARSTINSGLDSGAREPRVVPEVVRRETLTSGVNDTESSCEWPDPLPLTEKIDSLPYPVDALPEVIRAAVEEVQDFVQAPVPMITGSALATVSLAAQAYINVERASRLNGPVSLSLLTIAESGERKSTCDGFFATAIRNYEAEQAEFVKPKVKTYEAEAASWNSKRAGLLDAIKTATKTGKPCGELEKKLHKLQQEEPRPPKIPRLIYHDTTQEALVRGLAREWPSGGVISSEAGAVFGSHGMGQDSLMRNLSTYNLLWDGATLRFDRRGEGGSFTLRGARLTVSLQVQEPTIKAFFEKAGALARGTGFLARFLIAWPESTQGTRLFKEPSSHWPALAAFHTRITEVLNVPTPINEDGALEPHTLTLSTEAKEAWILFHDTIEHELRCAGELTDIPDVASKAADNVARLAALFHILEHGPEAAIEAGHIEAAGRIVAWHLNESRRFFGELSISTDSGNVARLDSWLHKYCITEGVEAVSTRTVTQYGPGPVRKKEALDKALHELIKLDRARLIKNCKQKTIQINPALIEGMR